eukprot:1138563-Pelagomonas_calceolata.AAC.2
MSPTSGSTIGSTFPGYGVARCAEASDREKKGLDTITDTHARTEPGAGMAPDTQGSHSRRTTRSGEIRH